MTDKPRVADHATWIRAETPIMANQPLADNLDNLVTLAQAARKLASRKDWAIARSAADSARIYAEAIIWQLSDESGQEG